MNKTLKTAVLAATAALALAACKQEGNAAAASGEKPASAAAADGFGSPVQRASYALGMDIGTTLKRMKDQGTEVDLKVLNEAVQTLLEGKEPKLNDQQAQEVLMAFMAEQQQKAHAKVVEDAKANLEKGQAFLKENGAKEGVKTTASGLQYQVKTEGTGAQPKAADVVTVEYEGRLIDGTVFDSSKQHGGTATFPLNQVIKGWTEGIQLMKEGGEYTLFIPAALAYGENAVSDKIGPNATLVFDVKLLKVEKAKAQGK
ncbi:MULTISPECIES: FKBP-type peptidyl-prolyl cis-trans isomerase [Neisseria]|uniref:Peptidyl-prolyl cis-trans isomerase n=1 Tax=Neisseria musculi TaxID=1815583 RepID=A0A7H1MAX3_9NEIS|nr:MULTISPECIES: FKBP-type peptidyl-prolyl cis-trans isomerase [Neisseria]MBF0804145.1 FKBP-type peptidyl-prolyl cis-trans isomerase [Neisseria sp. 19428wB4_WF04]QNT58788.1 putative FKBP-type peptidyl-prolyl cis-trans isomerase FkpA [Neisseria musculi]TFU43102.1 FKBP-type peptidyl-prolyl cis-trans isomerase [Neisseria sp. WF04]